MEEATQLPPLMGNKTEVSYSSYFQQLRIKIMTTIFNENWSTVADKNGDHHF